MDFSKELEGKTTVHDSYLEMMTRNRTVLVPGAIIVGAGPSGLAVAACLKQRGVPSLILERESCIASLWRLKTYDRLHLHLPKQFCQLPLLKFPQHFPRYPTKHQFLDYLERYRSTFGLDPVLNTAVVKAEFDPRTELWRVLTTVGKTKEVVEYVGQWLVVATGENGAEVVPEIEGLEGFDGPVVHTSSYKSGEAFSGKEVLVVGCGNSGMEVCLDLCNYNARPSLVVRHSVHVLPQEILGRSIFGVSMWLLKLLPVSLVDRFLLFMSRLILGDTAKLGLPRPDIGPLQLKNTSGKTPVLDVGTLAKIRSGHVKVYPGIKRIINECRCVEFVDGRKHKVDCIILATGYKSNVPLWLKEKGMFGEKDGMPGKEWKGESGLYAVGFTKRGLLGASIDAIKIAQDIFQCGRQQTTAASFFPTSLLLTSTITTTCHSKSL